jgi:hypothetical protein
MSQHAHHLMSHHFSLSKNNSENSKKKFFQHGDMPHHISQLKNNSKKL